jgi:hypothetical protein
MGRLKRRKAGGSSARSCCRPLLRGAIAEVTIHYELNSKPLIPHKPYQLSVHCQRSGLSGSYKWRFSRSPGTGLPSRHVTRFRIGRTGKQRCEIRMAGVCISGCTLQFRTLASRRSVFRVSKTGKQSHFSQDSANTLAFRTAFVTDCESGVGIG